MNAINGKVVWITGASSGIGEALAYELAGKNCKLILSARNSDALETVKSKCSNTEVAILPFDLVDFDNAKNHAEKAIAAFGKVDLLINNGGVSQRSLIVETDFEVDKKLIETDYLGTVALTKALLPHFIKNKKGHFVTITSLMGKFGSPYRSGYCGAKHALHGFFDVLRMEHQKDNISVTLVCPGFIQTNVAKNALTADGSKQNIDDEATQNGMPTSVFAKKFVKAVESDKFEVYIGGKETLGVYMKRFFPKWLHYFVLKSKVR
ncbi:MULTISPECIES: SDR family oxidoreductase [unclassified Flavobacterium]|jgi:short-subunit dehydrogenase|uniref:SDR family oxidoreductase n=1 Tax=unclassified Flavobacterium TaxID=196869 RepID=UPI000EB5412A|nr:MULTISPECIES: SDR family oxidoreductase [unclassified Flavobacterium]RKS15164.1 short-subunit dehydrogenase [Flavobacterium sp. 120]WKL43014.1 SDR family oxidoreductase [Flavobacterium sp. ZE23DGlu08]